MDSGENVNFALNSFPIGRFPYLYHCPSSLDDFAPQRLFGTVQRFLLFCTAYKPRSIQPYQYEGQPRALLQGHWQRPSLCGRICMWLINGYLRYVSTVSCSCFVLIQNRIQCKGRITEDTNWNGQSRASSQRSHPTLSALCGSTANDCCSRAWSLCILQI